MKLSIPNRETQKRLFLTLSTVKYSWEYRLATVNVILTVLAGTSSILIFKDRMPPAVPLWYSRPWGEDRLASPWFLFLPLFVSAFAYLINTWVALRIGSDHPIFVRVLFLSSCLVSALSFILVVRIITLVS